MNEGKKDRRDPIRTIKSKNPVAKNANAAIGGGAAGAHKDKSKTIPRKEKHKNAEYAESLQARLDVALLEDFDSPEYNDEAGMARGNLLTLARAVKGLIDTIDTDDNLPEWCQEKIAKSEMMLVTVWDYLLSQKEQGIDPSVKEAGYRDYDDNRQGFKRREREDDEYHVPDPEVSEASINEIKKGQKDSNGNTKCWTGYHAAGTKKGKNGKPVRNCVPNEGVESWTHDSLAAQLFETENTYEDRLTNLLNKQLGK